MNGIWLLLLLFAGTVRPVCGLIAWRWWLNFNRDLLNHEVDTANFARTAEVAESFLRPLGETIGMRLTARWVPTRKEADHSESPD